MSSTPATAAQPRRLGQSVWAIVAGFLFVVILSLVTDALFHKLHVFPPLGEYTPDKPLVLATAYRVILGIIGSYITARLAPHSPMRHALIGGCIGILLGILGAPVTWNRNLGPHWYPVALVVFALPQSWLGAKLFLRRASCNSYGAMRIDSGPVTGKSEVESQKAKRQWDQDLSGFQSPTVTGNWV